MMIRRTTALLVAASALWMAGTASQAFDPTSRPIDRCIDACNAMDHNCRFDGQPTAKCLAGSRNCAAGCYRTGKPLKFWSQNH
jgi:hypothetical protein